MALLLILFSWIFLSSLSLCFLRFSWGATTLTFLALQIIITEMSQEERDATEREREDGENGGERDKKTKKGQWDKTGEEKTVKILYEILKRSVEDNRTERRERGWDKEEDDKLDSQRDGVMGDETRKTTSLTAREMGW